MSPTITRNERIQMYSAYPGALEEEVAQVFATLSNDENRVTHNIAVIAIAQLFSTADDQRLLWRNVAKAIIDTAIQGDTSNGKAAE